MQNNIKKHFDRNYGKLAIMVPNVHRIFSSLKIYFTGGALALLMATSAFAAKEKSLYERLGGEKGVNALANAVISQISADKNLIQNPDIQAIKAQLPEKEAKHTLSIALCHASGGPCKKATPPSLKGNAAHPKLGASDWLYLIQDANAAMDKQKVGTKERSDLLDLILKAKDQ
jgi:hemoglobin